jgi:hypothetical protein
MKTLDVLATSLTRSVVVNSVLVFGIALWLAGDEKPLRWFMDLASERPLLTLGASSIYVLCTFTLSFLIGFARGALHPHLSFQSHLVRNGMTPNADSTSVWEDVVVAEKYALGSLPKGHVRGVWTLITFRDGERLVGRLAGYPQVVEDDKPFWFTVTNVTTPTNNQHNSGMYEYSDAMMVHSADVQHVAVRYTNEEPRDAPARSHLAIPTFLKALSTWTPFWGMLLALLTGIFLLSRFL